MSCFPALSLALMLLCVACSQHSALSPLAPSAAAPATSHPALLPSMGCVDAQGNVAPATLEWFASGPHPEWAHCWKSSTSVVKFSLAELGAVPLPQPPECKWRDYEVFNYLVAGGPAPNIIPLSDGVHRVYIEWAFVEPGTTWALFGAADYPSAWCTYPFALPLPFPPVH